MGKAIVFIATEHVPPQPRIFWTSHMSVAQLKSEFLNRAGENLLPCNLPIEALISLARELAISADGAHDHDEQVEFTKVFYDFVVKLLSAQNHDRVLQFKKNPNELLPILAGELNDLICGELVSRLTGYAHKVSLHDLFNEHFAITDELGVKSIHSQK